MLWCLPLLLWGISPFFPLVWGGAEYKTVLFSDPDHGQIERTYIQYLPSSYTGQEAVPLLLDFHGWTSSAQDQMDSESQFQVLAEEKGFIVVFVDGTHDSDSGVTSWNIARETGEFGDVCDRDRDYWGVYECHYSCQDCDPHTSCKGGMTCYNDLSFIEHLVSNILLKELNIDPTRLHASGFSNGAQFTYYLATYSSLPWASVGVVSGSPLLGFGPLPPLMVPVIDLHGQLDSSIPYSLEMGYGRGPRGTVETIVSSDGLYYYDKQQYLAYLASGWECGEETEYITPMDGVEGWGCQVRPCSRGVGLVRCSGLYEHGYPFSWDKLLGSRIIWQFMSDSATRKLDYSQDNTYNQTNNE